MSTLTIGKRREDLMLIMCIEYVLKMCESGMYSVGRSRYGE